MRENAVPLPLNPSLPNLILTEVQMVLRKRDINPWMHTQKLPTYDTFLFVIEGACDITLDGAEHFRLEANKGMFIKAPAIYSSTQYILPFEYVWVGFCFDENSVNNFSFNRIYDFSNPYKISELLKEMADVWLSNSRDSAFRVMAYMYEVLGCLTNESMNTDRTYNYRRIKASCDFMEKNYSKRYIDVEELAEISNLSVSQFTRIFKAIYNTTPTRYMNIQRIEIAKRLLTGSSEQIGIIAEMCGFSSDHYFSKMFKQFTGMSPLKFRALMG